MSPNKTKQKNEGKKSDLDILKYCTEILIKREKRNKYQKEVKRNAEERTQEAKTPFF
jgi:dihydroxyacetone kinase-like predicted kinase